MIPAAIVGGAIHLFPFSPRWLAMRDRHEDSLNSLATLRRPPTSHEQVQLEWKEILAEVQFQRAIVRREHPNAGAVTAELLQWVDLFRPKYIRRTL